MKLGTNLSDNQDWSSQIIFSNVMRQARDPWIATASSWSVGKWNGQSLAQGQYIRTLIFRDVDPYGPTGSYVCRYKPGFQIKLSFAVSNVVDDGKGTITFDYDGTKDEGILVDIIPPQGTTTLLDGDIVIHREGVDPIAQPFDSELLTLIREAGGAFLRFMDLGKTNNSTITTWGTRRDPRDMIQTGDIGAAYEHMIDLCNAVDVDMWLCLPHGVDDHFVAQLAQLVDARLNDGLHVYIEYTNEAWNSIFTQFQYCIDQGKARGLHVGRNEWEGGLLFYAERTNETTNIFRDQFVDDSRVSRVLAGQHVNVWYANMMMNHIGGSASVDLYATAPYFSGGINEMSVDDVINTSLDDLFDMMDTNLRNDTYGSFEHLRQLVEAASNHGLGYACYEMGQHMNVREERMLSRLEELNGDPRMKDIYTLYLTLMSDEMSADAPSCHYLLVGKWGRHGLWGASQSQYPTGSWRSAPKLESLMEFDGSTPPPPPPPLPPLQIINLLSKTKRFEMRGPNKDGTWTLEIDLKL